MVGIYSVLYIPHLPPPLYFASFSLIPLQEGGGGRVCSSHPQANNPTLRRPDNPKKAHGLPIASERRYGLQKKQEKGVCLQSAVDRGLPMAGIAEVHALADAFARQGLRMHRRLWSHSAAAGGFPSSKANGRSSRALPGPNQAPFTPPTPFPLSFIPHRADNL